MSGTAVADRKESSNGTAVGQPVQRMPTVSSGKNGLELRNLEDMWRFAQYVAKSGLAPKGIETPEAIMVAIQMGAEVGLTPMASLQNIAVINGRPSLWGDAMLAVCRASGVFDEKVFEEVVSPERASCTVCRIGGKPITRTFTLEEAKKAGLAGKSGPWQQYPQRMLQMRARSFALRDGFSDYLRGIRSIEEERDIRDGALVTDAQIVEEPRPRKLDDLTAKLNGKKPDGLPDDRRKVEPTESTAAGTDAAAADYTGETVSEEELAIRDKIDSLHQAIYGSDEKAAKLAEKEEAHYFQTRSLNKTVSALRAYADHLEGRMEK